MAGDMDRVHRFMMISMQRVTNGETEDRGSSEIEHICHPFVK